MPGCGRPRRTYCLLALGLALAGPAAAAARGSGDLDPSFAGDGRLALPASGPFVPRAVAIDARDRIVVAGYACTPDPATSDGTCLNSGDSSFRLTRLTPDGGLDPEFGSNGMVTTPVGNGRSQAYDLVVLSDGSIVAGGYAAVGERNVFALVRYGEDGALDPGFGTGGVVLQPVGTGFAAAADLAAGPRSTVIAAGQATDAAGAARMAVARFTPSGALDPAFGSGGTVIAGAAFGYALGVAVAPGGSVVTAGLAGASAGSEDYRFGELRLDASGHELGRYQQAVGTSSSFANAVIAGPRRGWLAAGAATTRGGRQAMALVRGAAGGALDGDFGRDGAVLVPILDGAIANDLVSDRAGRAIAIGQAASGGRFMFADVRLRRDGRRDAGFGAGGVATVGFDHYPVARATAGALQADGRLVTAGLGCSGGGTGTTCRGGSSVLLLARQLAGSDTTPPEIRIAVPQRVSRARVRKGIRLSVRSDEPARFDVRLLARGRRAPLFRIRSPGLGDRLAFRLRARRRLPGPNTRARLVVRASDAAGNAAQRRFNLIVR